MQLVSTPDCGSGGREFESHLSPLCPCSLRGRSGGLKIRRILDRYQSGALKNKKKEKFIHISVITREVSETALSRQEQGFKSPIIDLWKVSSTGRALG